MESTSGNGGPDTHADHIVWTANTWHDYYASIAGLSLLIYLCYRGLKKLSPQSAN